MDNTIRLGQRDDGTGFEYTLNGVATGTSFTGGHNFSELLDGTTNGVNNFGVECCGGTNSVMTANLFWQGGTVLFNVPGNASGSGIAYDTQSGDLWISLFDGSVHQFSLGGTDLGSFSIGFTSRGLAYDSSSNTIWALNGNTFQQYSKAGSLLNSVASAQQFSNPFGFEIDNGVTSGVPEPGTLGLMGVALALVVLGRRARKV